MSADGLRGRLFVVAGPSAAGKSTVLALVRRALPELWFSVSVTTRAPRPSELDQHNYRFVTREHYDRMVSDGELLEHAEYVGNGYGTPRQPVEERLAAGIDVLLEIDVQGAEQIKADPGVGPDVISLFLAPPSLAELRDRLIRRGTEDAATVDARLAAAEREMAAMGSFDRVVVNDEVGTAADALVALMAPARPGSPVS